MSKGEKDYQECLQLFKNIHAADNLDMNTKKRNIHEANEQKELLSLLDYKLNLTKQKLLNLKQQRAIYTDGEEILKISQQLDEIIEIYMSLHVQ